jgi:16S rRNA (guanine527-N7)-methyltransferase
MDLARARISELLQPFLAVPVPAPASPEASQPATLAHPCHFERSGESAFLSPSQLRNISIYIDLLLRWNARINLTAVRQPEEIVTRHFGESLFAARCLFPGSARAGVLRPAQAGYSCTDASRQRLEAPDLIDFGSGAGFPGLPIKLWATDLRVTLVESNQKKAVFLREAARVLALTEVDIFADRAETLTQRTQVVTLRAVERFDSALPVAASLVAPRGRLALLIGLAQADRVRQLLPSFSWSDPVPIPLSSSRILLVGLASPAGTD